MGTFRTKFTSRIDLTKFLSAVLFCATLTAIRLGPKPNGGRSAGTRAHDLQRELCAGARIHSAGTDLRGEHSEFHRGHLASRAGLGDPARSQRTALVAGAGAELSRRSRSQELLLSLYEGKTIDFLVQHGDRSETIKGKIIRSGYVPSMVLGQYQQPAYSQPIIEVDGVLRFGLPGQPLFPALTGDTILKPTLNWQLRTDKPGHLTRSSRTSPAA